MPPVLVTSGKGEENPPHHILTPRWVRALASPWSLACIRVLHVSLPLPPPLFVLHLFPESFCSWFLFLGVNFPRGRGAGAPPLPGSNTHRPPPPPPSHLATLVPSSDCFVLSSYGKGSINDNIQFVPGFDISAYGQRTSWSSPWSITGHAPRETPWKK